MLLQLLLLALFADFAGGMPQVHKAVVMRVCRRCKLQYNEAENTDKRACRYHTGRWLGAENSKHVGGRSGVVTGLSLFWDCCDSEDVHGVGCASGLHLSYDDDGGRTSFMLNQRDEGS